jgi:hypothetical protein
LGGLFNQHLDLFKEGEVDMRTLLVLLTLMLGTYARAENTNEEIKRSQLLSCVLNKSFTLEVYEEKLGESDSLIIEHKSFLDHIGQGEKLVTVNLNAGHTHLLRYGNTVMLTYDAGRSGYYFMRIEKNVKPSVEDMGNATVTYDNNLFPQRESWYFTDGKLKAQRDCTYFEN